MYYWVILRKENGEYHRRHPNNGLYFFLLCFAIAGTLEKGWKSHQLDTGN